MAPYKLDLFAIFIFLGIVQAIFLSTFFFSKENRKVQPNLFHGLMLVCMAGCILEIFLMYTGYIQNCLHMVDFSEPLSLAFGPCFYLMVISLTNGSVSRKHYLHFIFPVLYTILMIPFFIQPEYVKYNTWVETYKLNLPLYDYDRDPRIFGLTDYHTELTLISLLLYGLLGLWEMIKAFRAKNESFFKPSNPVLKKLKSGTGQILFVTVLIVIIKLFNPNDTGDHIIAAYIAMSIYVTSFRVIGQSGFFKSYSLHEPQKYKGSTLTAEQQSQLLAKLHDSMQREKLFLKPDFSLPELAQHLGTNPHVLSQAINDGLGKTFFEMTAEFRIEEAKHLLKTQRNIKVEEIAEQVGYNSKSSFNTAFKKITGKTPSEFRNL